MFHCAEVGSIDTALSRTVHFSWRGLIQHLILIQADGEAEVLVFIRVGKKGSIVNKQQLADEFPNGFRAWKKTLKVEHTTVCSETDVDDVWHVLLSYGA